MQNEESHNSHMQSDISKSALSPTAQIEGVREPWPPQTGLSSRPDNTGGVRLKQLDVLRGVAILMVLGRHMDTCPQGFWAPARLFFDTWKHAGWVGVDLFFVLSGFLVSGLLFGEYKRHRTITVRRFLMRRALKIYPAFYFLLFVTVIVSLWVDKHIPLRCLAAEALYVQNYAGRLWWHTWSLAVEEHFYLLLSLCLVFMVRWRRIAVDPFRGILSLVFILGTCLCALRIVTAYIAPVGRHGSTYPTLFATHLRIDSLAWGVLLSYLYHFRLAWLKGFVSNRWKALVAVSLLLICPCLFLKIETSMFMKTVGLTGLYLGFGGLLVVSLFVRPSALSWPARFGARLTSPVALIGVYSYSIYLWHVPMVQWGLDWLRRTFPEAATFPVQFLFYACGSLMVGIVLSKLIEMPILALRDKFFPSRNGALRTPKTFDPVPEGPLAAAV